MPDDDEIGFGPYEPADAKPLGLIMAVGVPDSDRDPPRPFLSIERMKYISALRRAAFVAYQVRIGHHRGKGGQFDISDVQIFDARWPSRS